MQIKCKLIEFISSKCHLYKNYQLVHGRHWITYGSYFMGIKVGKNTISIILSFFLSLSHFQILPAWPRYIVTHFHSVSFTVQRQYIGGAPFGVPQGYFLDVSSFT